MQIVGRIEEQNILFDALMSERPEFLVVYGRRRVGKTYLIKEYFENDFSFFTTAVKGIKLRKQLSIFFKALKKYGYKGDKAPSDWFDAFSMLEDLLKQDDVHRNAESGKRIIFIDETPWFDSPKSDFKSALDYFWNSFASSEEDIILIVCGSATSWVIENLLTDKGGFHNRLTRQIKLNPFSLREASELLLLNHMPFGKDEIATIYMVFGGIPYYLNLLNPRLGVAANIDNLLFKENGQLHDEYNALFASLFKSHEVHSEIINLLSNKKEGLTRSDIEASGKAGSGATLTRALRELEQCGFIRKYVNYLTKTNDAIFQLIDPFCLFAIRFLVKPPFTSWSTFLNSPAYYAWRGNAFENLILNHVKQIKSFLQIGAVQSMEYSFRSNKKGGVQIDLLIDRKDGIVNLIEEKYTDGKFSIDADYEEKLIQKIEAFKEKQKGNSSIHLTFVSAHGLYHNEHSHIVNEEIILEDLFL